MAKKTDAFNEINTQKTEIGTNDGAAYTAIERGKSSYKQQGTASKEEQEERRAAMKTQGRKGCHAFRINTAVSPDNHEFLRVMSKLTGTSMTQYINFIIDEYRKANGELYEQAKKIIDATGINKDSEG